jgi:hypothetical protein
MESAPSPGITWRLDVASAFARLQGGMTSLEHRARYGFDLNWIHLKGEALKCQCGDEIRFTAAEDIAMRAVSCGSFIERHAQCGRARAKSGRAA